MVPAAPVAFPFFFSYARDDYNPFLAQFLTDLTERVRGKIGLAQTAPIHYRDLSDIEPGQKWEPMLETALQYSKVMLCMYSPRYFQRWVCGAEMQAFIKRQETLAEAERTFLVPVIWIPCEDRIPASIKPITFHFDEYGENHKAKGLEPLTRQATGRYQANYEQCLEAVAIRITKGAVAPTPLRTGTFSFGQLTSAFDATPAGGTVLPSAPPLKGPDSVDFLYIAGTQAELAAKPTLTYYGSSRGDEWRLFPSEDSLGQILANRARRNPDAQLLS